MIEVIGFSKRALSRTPRLSAFRLPPMNRLFGCDFVPRCHFKGSAGIGQALTTSILLITNVKRLRTSFRSAQEHPSCSTAKPQGCVPWVVTPFAILVLVLPGLSGQAMAAEHRGPVSILKHLVAPFRSRPFLQSKASPCEIGIANCFSPNSSLPPLRPVEPEFEVEDSAGPVLLELRTKHGGPFAHHWLELESSAGRLTIGFGPATLPFIDAGQVSLQDRYGNVKRISGMHPLPWLTLPPINYHYAKAPGEGHIIGEPIPLTKGEAEALAQKMQHVKFVGPYIPIFHDCRTFACKVQATAQHRSTLPCYLLFKGYW